VNPSQSGTPTEAAVTVPHPGNISGPKNASATSAACVVSGHFAAGFPEPCLTEKLEDGVKVWFVRVLLAAGKVVRVTRQRDKAQSELSRGCLDAKSRISTSSGNGRRYSEMGELLVAVTTDVGRPQAGLVQQPIK